MSNFSDHNNRNAASLNMKFKLKAIADCTPGGAKGKEGGMEMEMVTTSFSTLSFVILPLPHKKTFYNTCNCWVCTKKQNDSQSEDLDTTADTDTDTDTNTDTDTDT